MIIPTKEYLQAAFTPFLQDTNLDVSQKAQEILRCLDQLEQLSENQLNAFGDNLYNYCLEAQHPYLISMAKAIRDETCGFDQDPHYDAVFTQALHQACLYLAYHYPKNDKSDDGNTIDPISLEPIAEKMRFVSLDRWHFNVTTLSKRNLTKYKHRNPMTNHLLLNQEITWLQEIIDSTVNPAVPMIGKGRKLFSNDNATYEELFCPSQRANQVFYANFFKRPVLHNGNADFLVGHQMELKS